MNNSVRIAQVGIAHTHATKTVVDQARDLWQLLDVEFCGIFEPDSEMWGQRHARTEYAGVHWFESAEEIFADEDIRAVYIETWPWDSVEWARRGLEAGKHVHLDKPPGTSLPALRSLLDLAAKQGLCVQMGYQWRFNPGLQFIQEKVKEDLLGRVFFARFRAGSTPEYFHRNHVDRYPGGIMQEEACHLFDQAVTMFGRPDRVTSFLHSDAKGFEGIAPGVDNASVMLEFDEQGAMAVIETTSMECDPGAHRRVEVHGEDGSIVLEPIEPPALDVSLRVGQPGYPTGWHAVDVADRPRYVGDHEEFIAIIRGQRQPLYSPQHDLLTQETLIRACGGDLGEDAG
jgi:predicted dehydrogenase